MSQVEELYLGLLLQMRDFAKDKKIPFEILAKCAIAHFEGRNFDPQKQGMVGLPLQERFKLRFYEYIANKVLENSSVEPVKLINGEVKSIIKAALDRDKTLKAGRSKGAKVNNLRAEAVKELCLRINSELLKNPNTADWTLVKRAKYIAERLPKRQITIENKTYKATQINGENYKASTIKNMITGAK